MSARALARRRTRASGRAHPARVLYVSATDEVGGSDQSLYELVRCVDRGRFEPHVVLPRPGPFAARYRALGVPVHLVPLHKLKRTLDPRWHLTWLLRAPARVHRLRALLAALRPALVHVNSSVEVLAGLAARGARLPVVWHVREAELRPRAVERAITALVARSADAVVAISQSVAQRFAGHPLCRVIPNGLDLTALPPRATPPQGRVLGWLGRLAPGKGLEHVLALFERLAQAHQELRLRVVAAPVEGHARYAARLRARARASGFAARIAWLDGTDAPGREYAAFDLLVHLPDLAEGLGRSVLEAQAVGTPVLTWDCGGLRDALVDEATGRLVRYRDHEAAARAALHLLVPATLQACGRAARAFARERFAAETVAWRIERLYEEVLR